MSTLNNNNKNKLYSYIIILVSLFILVLFTRVQVTDIQVKKDEISINKSKEQSLRNDLNRLNEIRNKINNDNFEIDKYMVNISEDEIIDYIYSKIEQDNRTYLDWVTTIRSISMNKWDLNELWFKELTINLNLRIPSEDRMIKILDFFTWEDSKYKFFISSFSYPNVNNWSVFNVSIPLKVFYK